MKHFLIAAFLLLTISGAHGQNVGIGTTNPSATLHVNGDFKLTDGTEGIDKVLTSDADGKASWRTAAGLSSGSVGYGAWGDCSTVNISDYNPVSSSDIEAADGFGSAVAMSGDYAIVGAPDKNVGAALQQGKAYIFHYDGANWAQDTALTAPDGAASDHYGYSVSINGNYAMVAATGKDVNGNASQGKLYVYKLNGTTWAYDTALLASDGAADDQFGYAICLKGNRVIVGAPFADVLGIVNAGSCYIFKHSGSGWAQEAIFSAGTPTALNDFGTSVSICDSALTLYAVAGAPGNGGATTGKAYLYYYNGIFWVQSGNAIVNSGTSDFADKVTISKENLVIGAYSAKKAFNYKYSAAGGYQLEAQLDRIGGQSQISGFGNDIAVSGKYVLVGAVGDAGNSAHEGKCLLYTNDGARWRLLQEIKDPGAVLNAYFGEAVAIDGKRFLIGAPRLGTGTDGVKPIVIFGKIAD